MRIIKRVYLKVELVCYTEHMGNVNGLITRSYNLSEMLHISVPIMGFAQEVIDAHTPNLIFNELRSVFDKLRM